MTTLIDLAELSGDELVSTIQRMLLTRKPSGVLLKDESFDWNTLPDGDVLHEWYDEYTNSLELLSLGIWGLKRCFGEDPQAAFSSINTLSINALLASLILIRSDFLVDSFTTLRLAHERTLSLLYIFQKTKEIESRASAWLTNGSSWKPGDLRAKGLKFSRKEYDEYCKVVHMSGVTFQDTYNVQRPSSSPPAEAKSAAVTSSVFPHNAEFSIVSLDQIWPDFWSWQPLPGNVEVSDRKSVHRDRALRTVIAYANNELSMLARANMRAAAKTRRHLSNDLQVWKVLLLKSDKLNPGNIDSYFNDAFLRDLETEAIND